MTKQGNTNIIYEIFISICCEKLYRVLLTHKNTAVLTSKSLHLQKRKMLKSDYKKVNYKAVRSGEIRI